MPNFNQGRKFGGNSNKKYSERSSFGNKSFGAKNRGPMMMHKATCDDCGNVCEVPFKPTSGKPVFCNNCFKNNNGGSTGGKFESNNRFERRDDRRSFGGKDNARPAMHPAICDNCGDDCEVPFRPTGDKPIYCKQCFGGKDSFKDTNTRSPRPETKSQAPSNGPTKEQFEMLNTKLDKILKLLTPTASAPTAMPEKVATKEAKVKAAPATEEPTVKVKKTSKVVKAKKSSKAKA